MRFLLVLMAVTLSAQSLPNRFFTFGASYDAYQTPHVTGGADFSTKITDIGGMPTYSCTSLDFTPLKKPRGAVSVSVETGICQVFARTPIGDVIALGQIGVTTSQNATGGIFAGGAGLIRDLGPKFKDWKLVFAGKFEHSVQPASLGKFYVRFGKEF